MAGLDENSAFHMSLKGMPVGMFTSAAHVMQFISSLDGYSGINSSNCFWDVNHQASLKFQSSRIKGKYIIDVDVITVRLRLFW